MAKNAHKEIVLKLVKILQATCKQLENSVNDLSKSQYDKGWHKGKETSRAEKPAKERSSIMKNTELESLKKELMQQKYFNSQIIAVMESLKAEIKEKWGQHELDRIMAELTDPLNESNKHSTLKAV